MKLELRTLVALLFVLIGGCEKTPDFHQFSDNERSEILSRFQRIELGMSKEEVKKILGGPLFDLDRGEQGKFEYYWDTPERAMKPHESPYMASGIRVAFIGGKVSGMKYNHQWVNQAQLAVYRERKSEGNPY